MRQRTAFVLALTLVVTAGLLGLGLYALSRPAAPLPPPDVTPTAAPLTAQHVARVNQQLLTRDDLATVYAIDHALSTLLGQPTPTSGEVLERQINAALVLQAADGENVGGEATLYDFATARDLDVGVLTRTLAHYGVSPAVFEEYHRRLRQVDRALQQAPDEDAAAYVLQLREASDVEIFTENIPVLTPPPTATPAPTGTPTATATPPVERGTSSGDVAPDFDLPTLSGEPERLTWADLRGAPTVLSFWVTWCGHCRDQTPRLVAAHERYAETGIQFIGVNIKEEEAQVQSYVEAQAIPYPMLLDTEGIVGARYQVSGLPTTYFLDSEGHVVARHVGGLQTETLEQYITQLQAAP